MEEELYFLRSQRLGFRRWQQSDLPLALALWGDSAVAQFISSHPLSEADVRLRLARELESHDSFGIQYWPIFLLSTGEHVGCCGLRPRATAPDVPELGVHIRSAHWRRGFAFEATSVVISYAFDVLGYSALFAGHNPRNESSRALLARLGFTYTHDELYPPTGLSHPSYTLARPIAPTI